MPLLRRVRAAAVCTALLASGCLVTGGLAHADAGQAVPSGCVQGGPTLRYLVVFDTKTTAADADTQITSACGATTIYYPQIAVAVATSADPSFGDRIGPERAYSAQAQALYDADDHPGEQRKSDETEGSAGTSTRSVPTEDRGADQWDMSMIRAQAAHKIDEGSPKVVVGVLDSGIDPNHPNLAAELDRSASAGCVTGAPDTDQQAWTPTTSAHGTHVAGTIAAGDDGHGIAGVAPGVRVASVKVVDDDGYIYPEAAVCGFMWAAQNGMAIANSSYFVDPWVFDCQDQQGQKVIYTAMQRAVAYATAHGVLSIAAAGNQGVDLTDPGQDGRSPDNVDSGDRVQRSLSEDCVQLPAGLPGVVTVSSVGADELKAGYSSYGLGAIDLTAPGGDSRQHATDGDSCVLSTVPGGYGSSCGTSMAAPHVAGVAALLASTHPHATPKQLTGLLDEQAQPVACPADYDLNGTGMQDAYCTGDSSYNSFYGHGLVDALAAVTQGVNSPQSAAPSTNTPVSGSDSGTIKGSPATGRAKPIQGAGSDDSDSTTESSPPPVSVAPDPDPQPPGAPVPIPNPIARNPILSSLLPAGIW